MLLRRLRHRREGTWAGGRERGGREGERVHACGVCCVCVVCVVSLSLSLCGHQIGIFLARMRVGE
jgi:hypothetical protein